FLSDDFRIYVPNEKGSLRSDSALFKGGCHYRGYVEGFPSSAVTLSTCSGLRRGLLQFENVSYGIEPLGHSPAFEHFVYPVSNEKAAEWQFVAHVHTVGGWESFRLFAAVLHRGKCLVSALTSPWVVFQCDYLGSDTSAAAQKIIQVFNLVNSVFRPLNVTVVLSALELWKEGNEIPTAGEADVLLQGFLQWKQSRLAQRPSDMACLFVSRDRAEFVGATALGEACQSDAAAAVAVYQRAATLESFSALLAQLLAQSLGVSYDDPQRCRCPGSVCIMTPEALGVSGAKAFSDCSIGDFETFLKRNRDCPLLRHALRPPSFRATVCGNGVVEPGEQCDCGAAQACAPDTCCTPQCHFKPGTQCSSGPCCERCRFKGKNSQCRPAADTQCDLAEFCNGSSASCPPDLYVQDGHGCEHGTGYCYKGRCQSPDLQCRQLYGRGAKNAPLACYEEVNSQKDRFGHCGNHPKDGYQPCSWTNLECGKLVCIFPDRIPFTKVKGAIIYAQVREHLCVSFDF
ncbi:ADA32 protein, partial [Glareola pratincola]|nr:ADA32 protein [Glareola pratincola]